MFTKADIDFVVNYRDSVGYPIYKFTPKGQLRLEILNMHLKDLNANLSRPLVYKEEVDALRKQLKQALLANA